MTNIEAIAEMIETNPYELADLLERIYIAGLNDGKYSHKSWAYNVDFRDWIDDVWKEDIDD